MTEETDKIWNKLSYGLASELGQSYCFLKTQRAQLDIVDGLHPCRIMIANQLAEDINIHALFHSWR